MIELIIPVMEADKKPQRYSYQQLKDLQSKLMLIAGKSGQAKEGVDRFVDVRASRVQGCVRSLEVVHIINSTDRACGGAWWVEQNLFL